MYHRINEKFKGRFFTSWNQSKTDMCYFASHIETHSVTFCLTEFNNSKPVSVESGMRKQQKVMIFCYNCYIGHKAFFNIIIQYLYIAGQYIPLCDEDGYYKPSQCHGSVGQCWCVDRYGNEVTGSRTNGAAECGKNPLWRVV